MTSLTSYCRKTRSIHIRREVTQNDVRTPHELTSRHARQRPAVHQRHWPGIPVSCSEAFVDIPIIKPFRCIRSCHIVRKLTVMQKKTKAIIVSAIVTCLYTTFTFALEAPVSGQPKGNTTHQNWQKDMQPLVRFGSSIMTRSRAERMLGRKGTLIDFHPCGANDGSCVEITALMPDDRVIRYVVADIRCVVTQAPAKNLNDRDVQSVKPQAMAPATPQTSKQISRKRPKHPAVSQSTAVGQSTTTAAISRPDDACLQNNMVILRSIESNVLSVTADGHLLRMTHVYQDLGRDRSVWRNAATLTRSGWITGLVTPPGGEDRGGSYELKDANGEEIASNSESWHTIAGSIPEASAAERCDARRQQIASSQGAAGVMPIEFCRMLEPDTIVVGGVVEWNVTFCDAFEKATNAEVKKAADTFYDRCLQNPDRMLTLSDPDATVEELAALIEFKTPYEAGVSSNAPSNCNNYTASDVEVDMGGGQICVADVNMECGETSPGSCYCEPASLASPMVCTDDEVDNL